IVSFHLLSFTVSFPLPSLFLLLIHQESLTTMKKPNVNNPNFSKSVNSRFSSGPSTSSSLDPPKRTTPAKSKEKFTFNSMTRANLRETVAEWHCANEECRNAGPETDFGELSFKNARARKKSANFIVNAIVPNVLLCGHFVCGACMDVLRVNSQDGQIVKCYACGTKHTEADVVGAPPAHHIGTIIDRLKPAGVSCKNCGKAAAQETHFPIEMMCYCETCNQSIFTFTTPFMCRFCWIDHCNEKHSHKKAEFSGYEKATGKLLRTFKALEKEGVELHKSRKMWHLAYLSEYEMVPTTIEIMACGCGHPYSANFPDNVPLMLDCGHLLCTECAGKKNSAGTIDCRDSQCNRARSSRTRPVIDLKWVMNRKPSQFFHCHSCGNNHTSELNGMHRMKEKNKWKVCQRAICLYCLFGKRYNAKHKHL
ncbi:hypothetical protein PFISCL1PPCAC_9455, partial [Pristionchus fissidentatus]